MKYDYIIVGQGLAGTVLAYILLKNNKKVLILDDAFRPSASKVAAGLYNPVTGMRLVKTWEAEALFPFLQLFYSKMEKELGTNFFYPSPLYRPFESIEIQNDWLARTERQDLKTYVYSTKEKLIPDNLIDHPLGGIYTNLSGFVDVNLLIECFRNLVISNGFYRNEVFNFNDLKINDNLINYKEYIAGRIIFCEGIYAMDNPYFNFLPFKPVKGEIFTLSIENIKLSVVINKGVYLFQLKNGDFKLGATYNYVENDWIISNKGKNDLIEKANKLIVKPFEIINHQVGVRPASSDRRPIIGLHPLHKNVGIFNGLGTKGISLAPYFANEFFEFLENGKEMNKEVQIERFFR